jgi:hypothetical protein
MVWLWLGASAAYAISVTAGIPREPRAERARSTQRMN